MLAEVTEKKYRVVRDCCSNGMCLKCMERGPFIQKRERVVQIEYLDRDKADRIANHWVGWNPEVEEMEDAENSQEASAQAGS